MKCVCKLLEEEFCCAYCTMKSVCKYVCSKKILL